MVKKSNGISCRAHRRADVDEGLILGTTVFGDENWKGAGRVQKSPK
jgi:hypothetical protein